MKTEEIVRQPRRDDPYAVSPALRDLAPISFSIITTKGDPVSLCSAGYVLHSGQSYRIRVVSALKDEDLQEIRLFESPEFLAVNQSVRDHDDKGNVVYLIPFRVVSWLTHLRGILVQFDDLVVVQISTRSTSQDASTYSCPIVLRPGRGLIIAYLFLAIMLPWLVSRVLMAPFTGDQPAHDAVGDALKPMIVNWGAWVWFTGAFLSVWLCCAVWNLVHVYRRSRELKARFRERYPAPKEPETLKS